MSSKWSNADGGVIIVFLGISFVVFAILQDFLEQEGIIGILQSAYVGGAAVLISLGGAWALYHGWSPSTQRRILGWTLLGGGFLFVLGLLGTANVGITGLERIFVLDHLTTSGCLGGMTTGLYDARVQQSQRQIRAERDRFETVVEELPLPTVVTELDGTVRLWNGAAEDLFAYDAAEIRGMQLPIIPAEYEAEHDEHLQRLARDETLDRVRTHRRGQDGTLYDVELWATPVTDPSLDVPVAVFVVRDRTRVELLEEQKTVLERVLRHNLRNELTVIRGYADTIADNNDEASAATAIRDAAERLITLSEHVGRLQRLSRAVTTLDVSDCVRDVVTEVQEEHPEVEITVETPEDTSVQAVPLLQEAIREALENAIEHTDVDAPDVSVSVDVSPEDVVRVAVADSGPGIPDMEWRPIESWTEQPLAHATGLGLWVMQWAAARSGGRLEKTDRDPTGTIVTFVIPKTRDKR
ncbi:PAS domain S-box protein [Halopenitus sp. H-Gu1]|uniref:PAS domain S-box protein n=1 Tax=Halopenitus sp. H-Gu1 TaxID=3242697 RepID=UPI00359D9E65